MHRITQEAVPHVPLGTAVITTASVQAHDASGTSLDNTATKVRIVADTKARSKSLLQKGVRANVLALGPFWTVLQASGGQPPEKVEKFGAQNRFGRPGQPLEITPVSVLLASQEGSFINGEVYGATGSEGAA